MDLRNRKRPTRKTIVFGAVQRDGEIRRRIIADVTGKTLKDEIKRVVDPRSRIMTDDYVGYKGIGPSLSEGGHSRIRHSMRQYARGDVHTNTIESSFALVKRGIMGVYHNVSKEYLHRYLWQFDFMWNARKLNDGERTVLAVKSAEGKRLTYNASPKNHAQRPRRRNLPRLALSQTCSRLRASRMCEEVLKEEKTVDVGYLK